MTIRLVLYTCFNKKIENMYMLSQDYDSTKKDNKFLLLSGNRWHRSSILLHSKSPKHRCRPFFGKFLVDTFISEVYYVLLNLIKRGN